MTITDLCFAEPAYIHREVSLLQMEYELTEEEAVERLANKVVLDTLIKQTEQLIKEIGDDNHPENEAG